MMQKGESERDMKKGREQQDREIWLCGRRKERDGRYTNVNKNKSKNRHVLAI